MQRVTPVARGARDEWEHRQAVPVGQPQEHRPRPAAERPNRERDASLLFEGGGGAIGHRETLEGGIATMADPRLAVEIVNGEKAARRGRRTRRPVVAASALGNVGHLLYGQFPVVHHGTTQDAVVQL